MNPDQLAGALLILACIAFAAISLATYAVRLTANRDQQMRQQFAPIYRDLADHEAWVRTGLTDYTPGETPMFEQLCVERWEHDLGDAS